MIPGQYPLSLFKGQTNSFAFAFKPSVESDEPLDLTGSQFELIVWDVAGGRCLSVVIDPDPDAQVQFDLTPEQTVAIPTGSGSRYELARLIGGNREVWAWGSLTMLGGR